MNARTDGTSRGYGADGDRPPPPARDAVRLLERHGRLAVSGPWGAGKSALLDALSATPAPWRCLRVRTQPGDEHVPYAAVAQLLAAPGAAPAGDDGSHAARAATLLSLITPRPGPYPPPDRTPAPAPPGPRVGGTPEDDPSPPGPRGGGSTLGIPGGAPGIGAVGAPEYALWACPASGTALPAPASGPGALEPRGGDGASTVAIPGGAPSGCPAVGASECELCACPACGTAAPAPAAGAGVVGPHGGNGRRTAGIPGAAPEADAARGTRPRRGEPAPADARFGAPGPVPSGGSGGGPGGVGWGEGGGSLGVRVALVAWLGAGERVLLVVDGAQWLDPASAAALGYALRALPADRLAAVVAERTTGHPAAAAALLGGHPPLLPVPPADLTETAAALGRAGLPARWAAPVREYTGGHRALLDACCAALRPDAHGGPRWPREVRELAGAWLATVPAEVRDTLQVAALARQPDLDLLRAAGRPLAEDHVDRAVSVGLLTPGTPGPTGTPGTPLDPDAVTPAPARFAARALAEAAAATGTARQRRRIHRALAGAVHDPVQRARHRALAQDGADQPLAEDTARAAAVAREAGDRLAAAELELLAARLTPADHPRPRLERLASAARDAAAAGRADLARQASDLIAAAGGSAAQRVHALLAVVDAHGQDTGAMEPLLASAHRRAAGDPALLAAVELRSAVRANITGGEAAAALRHAGAAARLARDGGDLPLEAAALTMRARMERVLGRLDAAPVTLARALSLAVPPPRLGIRNSPQYLAARHAVFDGRLAHARRMLTGLLPAAEAAGEAEDLVDVWRSMAEADAGLGDCARALHWSARAVALTAAAGLSPGPAWYTAALAHSCGGAFPEALRYAEQGVRASREERDSLHVARGLWVLGAVHLHTGEVERAAAALAEVADLEDREGAADPGILRWQGDAVEAFAASGQQERARALLERMRERVGPGPAHAGLRAALTRARAVCRHLEGADDEAAELLRDAARTFARLGFPVEEGRTRLTLGRLERGRRRRAAARASWEAALEVFEESAARPWSELTREHLARLTGLRPDTAAPAPGSAPGGPLARLTGHELRLAALVSGGATNREAAQRMFLSVKTVETMLSRVYRKLGIRSRTQLAAALAP
ncbi:LuxR C-terminal-related transcriptional regulator [Streptomyces sp. NPDC002033]|uniref:LuxR C-terminal-related transcriptional regulator n=1 Tax=unclassified Streptomyces TaxID=2593676 RepID=UPI0033187142